MNTTTEELTSEMVADFVAERQKMIGDAGVVKAGIYKFPNSNQVSIDLSVVVPETSREQALEFARLAGQESLFDLETFENIKTGATGENPMKFTPEQHREISKALKEGRMPNVFGTTAETTKNLLTKENVNEVTSKQTTPKNKLIVKAAKMVLNAIPGVKIYIHNNGQEMASAIEASKKQLTKEEKTGLTESSGLYVDGDIHINLESATIGTVYHEAFHALIEKNGMKSGSILLMAKGLKNIISDKGVKQRLDDFVSQYNEDEKAEEYISELGGILSEAEQELTTTKLQQFKTLINNIAKKLGLPVIFSASATAQDAADFINTMSKKLRTGEEIEINNAINVDTNELSIKQQKIGDFDVSYFEDDDEFKKLVKEGLVENNYDINKISGEVIAIHQPDNMFVGTLKSLDKEIFNGNGGVFYTSITGNVWASGAESSAKTLTNLINKSLKDSTDGIGRLVLVRGSESKMISSTEGVKASMSIIELLVDKGLINRSEFRSSLIRAGKKFNIDFSGKDSSAAIHKDIKEKFMDVKNSTFQKRGDFFDEVINDLSKTSKSATENIVEIRKALGSKRKISFSKDGIRDSIGYVLTERLLQDLPTSHVYAIIEVTDPVTYEERKGHDSYPWVLKSKSKPKLKLLSDRSHAVKDGVFEMIDGSEVSQAKLGLAQVGMGIAKISQQPSKIKFQKKAPNGKPSKLDDVQWEQVRTPAFKKWFGDWENDPENSSKVIDEETKEPLVVYHGSNYSDFTEFDDSYIGNNTGNAKSGFYFTNNYLSALSYTQSDWDWREEDEKDESTDERDVFYCFLNIRNPLEKNYNNKYLFESDWSFFDLALEENKDGAIQYNVIDNWSIGEKNKKKDYIGNNYIAFKPNQIKLADGTNTTFDATQPNIKFQKKAPSVAKIMGTPKPSMVTVKEKTALKDQIKLEARAAREAKVDLNQKRKMLSTAIKGLVKLGKLTTRQAATIINRVSVVNLDNQVMVNRLADYAARVFEKADYQERLSRAFSFRKGIRKLLKGDIQAEVVGMAKKFSKIDPSMVDDIEKYLEMAEIVKNAIKPSRINRKDGDVNMRESMNIDSVSEFTNDAIENQEAILKEELLAVHSELVDAGVIDDKMSLKDIESIINSLKEKEDGADYEGDILTFLSRRIDTMSEIIKDILTYKINPMTGEDVALTEKNIDLISRMLNIDINNLSIKETIFIAEAMDNFINNNITSSVEAVIEKHEGATELENLIADKVVASPLRKYFSNKIGQYMSEQIASMPILFEKLFVGAKNALMVAKKMGWTALINGVNKAEKMFNTTVDVYFKQYKNTKPNGKSFNDAENVYERGMLAFLSRNVSGTVTQQAEELKRRVEVLKESVKSLLEGSTKEQKMGEIYQKIYDKLNVESGDIDIISANADKINRSAVDWWINQWGTTYNDLSDISLSVYNTMLSSDTSYSTDRYKLLDKANLEEIIEPKNIGAFGRDIEFLDKNKTGVLMESNRPSASKVSKANRYISLDFDVNNSSAYKAALIDVNTAAAIRRIDGFINSKNFNKLIPTKEDRDIFRRRISEYIQAAKNKRVGPSDTMHYLDQLTNFLGGIGVGKALGGIDQIVKQTLPIALSTFTNSGRLDILTPASNAWIDSLGMAISNRGQESQSTIESIDRRLDKANSGAKVVSNFIVDAQQIWLKWCLSKPDVFIAKSSFISYYKQYLSNNNQSTDIDWATHNVNQDAADYAMLMVDRQQNVSDAKMAGKVFNSQNSTTKIMRKLFLPFASFTLNQKSRMVSDIKVLGINSGASKQDKIIAARSLLSLPLEMALYQSIGLAIRWGYLAIAKGIIGAVVDDDDEEKEKLLGMEISKEMKNATKYPLRSMVTDFLSPIPIADNTVVGGANYLLSQLSVDQDMIDEAVSKKNLMLEVSGKEKMNDKEKQNFIEKYKQDREYQLFNDEKKSYGTIGIGYDTYKELMGNINTAYTGKYTQDYMGNESERFLLPKDQDNIKNAVIFETLFALGIVPRDVNTISKNIIKLSKKNSLTEKQYEKYEAVGKETGTKVTGWKMDLTKSKSKLETTVSEIEWIEEHGGLTEKQGKEYVKLSKAVDEVSYRELQKIQSGKTADQIINAYSKK
jgi:hypothetical protein